ncbi:SpoIVB peptidase [Alkaliphilus peptidifermentans]|uniref:SpoIVB peptidase. Serine peptidase. MEROPS family S55 n=1 Tax=Alkaliphilus peptidifermentans DSM 18978 TaxID=1120976 RepID=A0A1G5KDX5_9FIRM|nr:SpoIVB peptidase [Alkaliphilus peptidifermentans]SCY98835.1 SpoIVB peptidase. Serine peptidase. MEROPS family S55 [Alkaliphilus peptidifermentans DSM 18978]
MNNNNSYKLSKRIFTCFFLIILLCIIVFQKNGSLPSEYNIQIGESHTINTKFPLSLSFDETVEDILEISKINDRNNIFSRVNNQIHLKSIEKGSKELKYNILGFIPYKTVRVNVVPKLYLYPGGQSIGVRLNTEGVLIVGIAEILDDEGVKHNIAEASGIRIGDSLMAINNQKVENKYHVIEMLQNSNGEKITLTIKRNDKYFQTDITPIKSSEDKKFKLGFWVRDKTAGVGTLTFFHEESSKFGALGHAITDVETGNILSVKDGEIIKSKVVSIQEGKKGRPGEIRGLFYELDKPLGRLLKNTIHGIYGELINDINDSKYNKPIEMAYQHEIEVGPAYILTTLDDNKVDRYDIEIIRINTQVKADSKSMIIRVTDDRLLNKTGGIVQGMSGSPIIQNNKVVGAVTHVLVNDPTKGYGIFIEWMVEESGIFDKKM